MAIILSGSSNYKPVPAGIHPARCIGAVTLGLQATNWGDKRQLYLKFEIPGELGDDGEPMTIGRTYTASLTPKAALRKDLDAWLGRPLTKEELRRFDITQMAGKPCLLNVSHYEKADGGTGANIAGILPLMKDQSAPPQRFPSLIFGDDSTDAEWEKLPEWLRKKIMRPSDRPADDLPAEEPAFNDDIPFGEDVPQ